MMGRIGKSSAALTIVVVAGLVLVSNLRSYSAPLPAQPVSDSAPPPAPPESEPASLTWFQSTTEGVAEGLTGRALAEALGLQQLAPVPDGELTSDKQGCRTGGAEVPEGGIFCLDAVLDPADPEYTAKSYVLGRALTGHTVSEELARDVEAFLALAAEEEARAAGK